MSGVAAQSLAVLAHTAGDKEAEAGPVPDRLAVEGKVHRDLATLSTVHGCQMAIARFSDRMCLALRASGVWTMAPLRCAAKFDSLLSLDCAPTPSTLAQSKERKGSNFAA